MTEIQRGIMKEETEKRDYTLRLLQLWGSFTQCGSYFFLASLAHRGGFKYFISHLIGVVSFFYPHLTVILKAYSRNDIEGIGVKF